MSEKFLYEAGWAVVKMYRNWMLDMNIVYKANLPKGAKILAPNHPTTIDPFLMTTIAAEPVHILVTESAFKAPLFGRYLRRAGHIPVVASNGRAAFEAANQLLQDGKTVAIFPEGALSPLSGVMGKPLNGVIRLALSLGVPVIPIGIDLDYNRIRFLHTGIATATGEEEIARLYSQGPYAVTVGKPLYLLGDVGNREYVRGLSDDLMQHIDGLRWESADRISRKHQIQHAPCQSVIFNPVKQLKRRGA